jgi:hypothetical protein
MKIYYLYRHIRLDKDEPFYIGIGTRLFTRKSKNIENTYLRAHSKNRRNSHWNNIVNKTSYKIEIICESFDYKFIENKEIEFIELYKRKIDGGPLANSAKGGSLNIGWKLPKDKCDLIAIRSRKYQEENKYVTSKEAFVYNENKQFLYSIPSLSELATKLNFNSSANISNLMDKFKPNKFKIYLCSSFLTTEELELKCVEKQLEISKRKHATAKPLYQYSLDGKFLQSFSGVRKAAKELDINYKTISCYTSPNNKSFISLGYFLSYDMLEPYEVKNQISIRTNKIRELGSRKITLINIIQKDLNGKLIEKFDNMRSIILKNPTYKYANIASCISGNTKSAYSFKWSLS